MAKKKAAARKKAPGKKKGNTLAFSGARSRGQSKAEVEKELTSGPLRKGAKKTTVKGRPKDQPLPGMEDMKDRALLREAAAISDIRAQKADLEASEAGHLQTVKKRMVAIGVMAFTAHGVEFARVPGEEVLRVRTKKGRQLVTGEEDHAPEPGEAPETDQFAQDAGQEPEGGDAGADAEDEIEA